MKAQLRQYNGTPTVFLNDKPAFFGCHLVGWMDPEKLNAYQVYARKYAEAGVHIYSVDILTHEWVGPRPDGPDNPSPYDFTLVAPRMQSYIDVDPQALFYSGWVLKRDGRRKTGGTRPILRKLRFCPMGRVGGSLSHRPSGAPRSTICFALS